MPRGRTMLQTNEVAPGHGAFLLAFVDGEAAGCGTVRRIEDGLAEVKRMYVRPTLRNRGLGTVILAAIETEARRLGITRLMLETGERQPEAIALYRRHDYERTTAFAAYTDSPGTVVIAKDLD